MRVVGQRGAPTVPDASGSVEADLEAGEQLISRAAEVELLAGLA